jgi:indole-3-glycerol phosphate synthase
VGILETICEERGADAARARRERPPSSLERSAGPVRPAFARAGSMQNVSQFAAQGITTRETARLARGANGSSGKPLLIAECKKASPSRGLLVPDYDPVRLASAYERGGAGMISVLTEPRRFLGSDEQLRAVRAAVGLPVLRKDFIVDPYQVLEAWAIGADAILLIAAALSGDQMLELAAAARELGLGILAEAHDASEVEKAAAAMPDAIGVNARDLRDFSIDPSRATSLFGLLPEGALRVAESGMKEPKDAAALRAAGFDAFLVGEALATAPDPEAATKEFIAALASAKGAR